MISKFLNIILRVFIETFHLILAVILLSGLFYLRLLPRISRALWEDMNSYQIFSTCLSITLIAINIYFLLTILQVLPNRQNVWSRFAFLDKLTKISQYFTWVLRNLYRFFWYVLEKFAEKCFAFPNLHYRVVNRVASVVLRGNKRLIFWFLILINVLPRIIFVIAFAYDVLWCKQLNYTFKCIPWLLTPLLEKFLIFIFENFYICHREELEAAVYEEKTENSELSAFYFNPNMQEQLPYYIKNLEDFLDNHLYVSTKIKQLQIEYEEWKYNVFPYAYTFLTIYTIRILLLSYLLAYGIL